MNSHATPTATYQAIVWSSDLETGVGKIDEQHKILVQTLNKAAEMLADDGSLPRLEKITQELLSYAIYHFDTEEEYMDESGYAEEEGGAVSQHLGQHRAFTERVVEMREGLRGGEPVSADVILNFLQEWLVDHIQKTDRLLGKYIAGKQTAQ